MPTTLLSEGNKRCPVCGEQKERLSRHWGYCEWPPLGDDLADLLTGVLLGGGSLQGNGDAKHLLVQTTNRELAEWLFERLGWLAHSLRRQTYDDARDPIYRVRTHAHEELGRMRRAWYNDGEKQLRDDVSLTPASARVWHALAGTIESTGDYDSQWRVTFSAGANQRADTIQILLDRHGYDGKRLDRRVSVYGDDARQWLGWTAPPPPGTRHKWRLYRYADPVTACPECDSSQISDRSTETPTWRCYGCGAVFDTPTIRPPKASSNDRETAIKALQDAAAAVDGPITQDDYNEWRGAYPTAPSGEAIQHRHGWADICKAAGVEYAKVYGATLAEMRSYPSEPSILEAGEEPPETILEQERRLYEYYGDRLPEKEQADVKAVIVDGETVPERASERGISRKVAYKNVRRGRERLREIAEDDGIEWSPSQESDQYPLPDTDKSEQKERLQRLQRLADAPEYSPNEIKRIRDEAGLTQSELAERLGTAQSTIETWEMGWHTPSARYRVQIREIEKQVRGSEG